MTAHALVYLITGLVTLTLIGVIYQAVATKLDERKYPPPGKMVDIGGYRLHINCSASQCSESPTVVMDAGLGDCSLTWGLVQPEIAKFAPVCSYDRAGLGWSDKASTPRSSKQITKELHALLNNAGIPGPYLLVGHSFGGLNMLLYASEYPEQVAGLVLIDSPHPDQSAVHFPLFIRLGTLGAPFGLPRLFSRFFLSASPVFAKDSKYSSVYRSIVARTRHVFTFRDEYLCFGQSLCEVRSDRRPGDVPLTVLTSQRELPAGRYRKWQIEHQARWWQLQPELAKRSTRGKQIIAENSGHFIQYDQPQLVIDAVRELVGTIRHNTVRV